MDPEELLAYEMYWSTCTRLEQEGVEITEDMSAYIRAMSIECASIASMFNVGPQID